VTGEGCVCPGCELQRLAGDVAQRVANLPHADLSEMVILRNFSPRLYLDSARTPLVAMWIRPGGDRGRTFLRALLGDVAVRLQLQPVFQVLGARLRVA
jgi:hypothetical protein